MSKSVFVSIGRRFSRTLIGVVTLVLLLFAAGAVWWDAARSENELEACLASTLEIAETSLAEPLWNFDHGTVANILDALLLEKAIVYAEVLEPDSGSEIRPIARRAGTVVGERSFEDLAADTGFAVTTSSMQRQGQDIGTIRIAVSKAGMRRELLLDIATTLALTLAIIAAIAITSLVITRRYVSHPLQALQTSAASIEAGDLATVIDVSSNDEVGQLAGSLSSMRDSIGHLVGELEEINRDLEQKVAERTAELAQAKEDAETASRTKSAFLANMSHELRTPLNAILGFAQLLNRAEGLTSDHLDSLRIIHRSGEHLLSLINDVLEISKIEAGRTALQEESFDLHQLIADVSELFQVRANEKDVALTAAVADDVPRFVRTDHSKLRQILINLVGNAVKFTDRGAVELRVGGGGPVRFEVQDTGVGIAGDDLETLFEAFVQSTETSNRQDGTGLGLSISQHFARMLGTDITVESQPGVGSTFALSLSVSEASPDEVPGREPVRVVVGLAPGQGRPQLLVVDDVEENRLILRRQLEHLGFEIREAVDGREGLELTRSLKPELVWMDMRMPVMDGYEATRCIKDEIPDPPPVVAITASAFEEDRQNVEAAGCDGFIRKPCSVQDLVSALETHLGLRFVYEDDEPADRQTLPAAEIPAELRAQLYEAASRADDEAVTELVGQLDQELQKELRSLLRDFQFDRIMAISAPA